MVTSTCQNAAPRSVRSILNRAWAFALLVGTGIVGQAFGDIPPPSVYGTDPRNGQISDRIERLQKDPGRVDIVYLPAERVHITVPQKYVAKVERSGLMEFAEAAPSVDPWMRNVIAGLALSACLIAAGIVIARRIRFSWTIIVATVAIVAMVVLTVGLSLIWPSLTGAQERVTWPKRTKLGIDVTVIEEGERITVKVPEQLRPPARSRPLPPGERDKK